MSAPVSGPGQGMDLQTMLAELKTNRRTQAALLIFAAVLGWMYWMFFVSDAPKPRRTAQNATTVSDPRLLQNLKRLPDLAALDKAGELPPKPKILRDLSSSMRPPRHLPRRSR